MNTALTLITIHLGERGGFEDQGGAIRKLGHTFLVSVYNDYRSTSHHLGAIHNAILTGRGGAGGQEWCHSKRRPHFLLAVPCDQRSNCCCSSTIHNASLRVCTPNFGEGVSFGGLGLCQQNGQNNWSKFHHLRAM